MKVAQGRQTPRERHTEEEQTRGGRTCLGDNARGIIDAPQAKLAADVSERDAGVREAGLAESSLDDVGVQPVGHKAGIRQTSAGSSLVIVGRQPAMVAVWHATTWSAAAARPLALAKLLVQGLCTGGAGAEVVQRSNRGGA